MSTWGTRTPQPQSPPLPAGAAAGHRGQEETAAACAGVPRQRRVTALYAQLLRELEAEVRELQRPLAARDEAVLHRERRIRQLEAENRQLRSHFRSLEEENDLLSSGGGPGGPLDTAATGTRSLLVSGIRCIGISDSNVQFLKRLVGLLESNVATEAGGLQPSSSPTPGEQSCAPADIPRSPCACCLPGGSSPCPGSEEGPSHPLATENGRPKLELVPNSGVYITHPQLDDLSQVPRDKPKLMTRRLLRYFFSLETLARSSATGQRIAHNTTTREHPLRLPVPVVSAIKEYVTSMCGCGCNFNAVINSKCGTSPCTVKKLVEKME